jgi:tetratricopeptide (TPR) repeat protein
MPRCTPSAATSLVAALAVLIHTPLAAQRTGGVPAARCPAPVPGFANTAIAPAVTVRLMAEGEFPDADAAAARALVMMLRDALVERAPVRSLTQIRVDRNIAATVQAAGDLAGIPNGKAVMSIIVQRVKDSISVSWNSRTAGVAARGISAVPANRRLSVRLDEIARVTSALTDAIITAVGATPPRDSLPAPLASVEAADAYVLGLAEALSVTPDALARARAALLRATTVSPTTASAWRFRATVEHQLADWYRQGTAQPRDALRRSALESATRATLLSPRSRAAALALADVYVAAGARSKAETLLRGAAGIGMPVTDLRLARLARLTNDDARAYTILRTAIERAPWDAAMLTDYAQLARTRGDRPAACHALNLAISSDAEFAPAYVLRGMLRAELGERREAWADVEVATRLGHPEWGERAAAILDVRYGEANDAAGRLRPFGGLAAQPTNALEAFFLAQAIAASASTTQRAPMLAALRCGGAQPQVLARDVAAAVRDVRLRCREN